MKPSIKILEEKQLIGIRTRMSFANNKTAELWRSFAPRKREILNTRNNNLYSIEIYNSPTFFVDFNPMEEFEKWAAIEVENFDHIPDGMEKLVIPEGKYAVFHYKGKPSEAQSFFQYIYGTWLPQSAFEMDNRPYFALMGEKYKGEDPDSEEEFWVPVRKKVTK